VIANCLWFSRGNHRTLGGTGTGDRPLIDADYTVLKALREYDGQKLNLEETLAAVLAYDELLSVPRDGKANSVAQASRRAKHDRTYATVPLSAISLSVATT